MSTIAGGTAEALPPEPGVTAGQQKLVWGLILVGFLVALGGFVANQLGVAFWSARWPMFVGTVMLPLGVALGFIWDVIQLRAEKLDRWRRPVKLHLFWTSVGLMLLGVALAILHALGTTVRLLGPSNWDWVAALGGALAVSGGAVWWWRPGRVTVRKGLLWAGAVLLAHGFLLWRSEASWRWVLWAGLVLFTVWVIVRWCWREWKVGEGGEGAPAVPDVTMPSPTGPVGDTPEATGRTATGAPNGTNGTDPSGGGGGDGGGGGGGSAGGGGGGGGGGGSGRGSGRVSQIEYLFSWIFAYPLLVIQIGLFWYISWGGFGEGLGLPDLVWGNKGWMQFWVGLAVSMLFCNVLFVRAVLDRRPGIEPPKIGREWSLFWFVRAVPPTSPPGGKYKALRAALLVLAAVLFGGVLLIEEWNPPRTLMLVKGVMLAAAGGLALGWVVALDRSRPGIARGVHVQRDPQIHQVGAFLLWTWLPALALFYFPKMIAWETWTRTETGWMPVGLLAGVVVTLVAVAIYEFWWRNHWTNSRFFNSLPGFRGTDPAIDPYRPLHALAGVLTALIPVAALLVFLYEHLYFGAVWSPVWLVCLFLALFNSAYGFVAFHFAGLQYVTSGLIVLVLVVSNLGHEYKMTLPGVEEYYADDRRPDLDGPVPAKPPYLIDTKDLLTTNRARWANAPQRKCNPFDDSKPKLVIVATTGGGIQASVWTALVLNGLANDAELKKADFRTQIRLMTGASGGMQGAGLYAADFLNTGAKTVALHEQLARDSLWPTIQTMLAHDLPGALVPARFSNDRGRELERAWWANSPQTEESSELPNWFRSMFEPPRLTDSPLAMTFADLRPGEAACERPVLVFSPMLVEDCRRVMISNLSVDWFTATTASHRNPEMRFANVADPNTISVPAIEFWRYFPDAHARFRVSTAARMSASFPYVGAAVSLPTNPARRVVDAGYFDNFGINFAAMWLNHYKKEVLEHTSGVVIVEIRAYPRREEKLRFKVTNLDGSLDEGGYTWAVSELSSPLEAIYNLYARGAYFRNDQLLHMLDEAFNVPSDPQTAGAAPLPFFTLTTFECPQPAALSWTLPERNYKELTAIIAEPTAGTASAQVERGSKETNERLKKSREQWQGSVRFLREWFTGDPVSRKQ